MISQTRAKAASTLTEITWCGRKVPVKNDKLRISLVHLRELCDEAQRKAEEESASQQLCEQIVLECHDTLQIIKEDLQQEKVTTSSYLMSVLQDRVATITVLSA